ncbi:LytTR family DNA-binding domain-containing protein [Pontixanthobacter luteolus]|uniref:LytTR family DNA-binding domain-containing protein n=1 Tax=Pontixanthobacter luteolus TaxID=295089 RepID=UPI002304B876|nr:LytTR family DNA-binding domain-containing protein [Pontixanthobacter luteolus]
MTRRLLIDLSIMTVIGVVLALIGPFGSASAPLAVRLGSWLLFAYVGYAAYAPIGWFVNVFERKLQLPRTGLWIAGTLIATIPLAAIIWCIGFWPDPVPFPTGEQALSAYFNVLIIGAAITVLFQLIERGNRNSAKTLPRGSAQQSGSPAHGFDTLEQGTAPRFLDRLPPELGTQLIALEMEDHYVRAHTALGSDLILMRMRDAVSELDGLEGEQVHRSWWVARGAVENVQRDGRNVRLILRGGLEAPVSRANVAPLKDGGWF